MSTTQENSGEKVTSVSYEFIMVWKTAIGVSNVPMFKFNSRLRAESVLKW